MSQPNATSCNYRYELPGEPINIVHRNQHVPMPVVNLQSNIPVIMQTHNFNHGYQYGFMPFANSQSNLPASVMPIHNLNGNQTISMPGVNIQPNTPVSMQVSYSSHGDQYMWMPVNAQPNLPVSTMPINNQNFQFLPPPCQLVRGTPCRRSKLPEIPTPEHPIDQLDVEELAAWVQDLAESKKWKEAKEYAETFRRNSVDGETIVKQNDTYLWKKLKIKKLGPCLEIMNAVRELHSSKAGYSLKYSDSNNTDDSHNAHHSCPQQSQIRNKFRGVYSDGNSYTPNSRPTPSPNFAALSPYQTIPYRKTCATRYCNPTEEKAFHPGDFGMADPTTQITNEREDASSSVAYNSQQQSSNQVIQIDNSSETAFLNLKKQLDGLELPPMNRCRISEVAAPEVEASRSADNLQHRLDEVEESCVKNASIRNTRALP